MSRSVVKVCEIDSEPEESHFVQRVTRAGQEWRDRQRFPVGSRRFYTPARWQAEQSSVSTALPELWDQFVREIRTMSSGRSVMMLISITLLTLIMGFIGLLITRSERNSESSATKKEEAPSGSVPDQSSFSMGF